MRIVKKNAVNDGRLSLGAIGVAICVFMNNDKNITVDDLKKMAPNPIEEVLEYVAELKKYGYLVD